MKSGLKAILYKKNLKPNDVSNLTEEQKKKLAWQMTLGDVKELLLIVICLAAALGIGVAAYAFSGTAITWIKENALFESLVIVTIAFGFSVVKGRQAYWIAQIKQLNESSWKLNEGKAPNCLRVNVERKNGKIEWNVKVSDVKWDLDVINPVIYYLPKG